MDQLFQLDNNEITPQYYRKYEEIIMLPYDHIIEQKGTNFRKAVLAIYNFWMNVDHNDVGRIADIIQWVHTILLLVDDIQDESELRRGIPAAHIIYGVGRTIAAVDLSTDIIYPTTKEFATSEYIQSALECAKYIFMGQAIEIYWRDNFICPTEEDYLYMMSRKSGGILKGLNLCFELFSTANINLNKISILFGTYFQLCNDYYAFKSALSSNSKGFSDDIREGKFSLPIVHAINSRPNDKRILNILKMHTTDIDLKNKCLELLEEFGSFEYTKTKLNYLKSLIIQESSAIGRPNPYLNKLFETTDLEFDE